jgi:cellulose synthase/poly-beta-1,6-N-acetylglucosamine synthase-like glycosyltransferase
MIALSRQRPGSITLFAVVFLAAALLNYIEGLVRIPVALKSQDAFPWLSRDVLIVWHSAWLSIAFIPVAMVWLSAVRFARWMVSFMAVAKVAGLLMALPALPMLVRMQPLWLASLMLGVPAVALLFTPASNRWFAHKGEADLAVFE